MQPATSSLGRVGNWLLLASISACVPLNANAEDLGVYGPNWKIAEPDAIDSIKAKIRKLEKDDTLQKRWESYRDLSVAGIRQPAPLPGISTSEGYGKRTFDPTYTYPESVKDETGKILVPAGTRLNPLDYQPMQKRMIFVDGRDQRQVAMAKKESDAHPEDKVILTAGSFINMTRAFGRPVYFDQKGVLTKHFDITTVPSVISQSGRVLLIEKGYKIVSR